MAHLRIAEITTERVESPRAVLAADEMAEITEMVRQMGFDDVCLLETSSIVTAHWVGLKCRYGCANYNTSWCCPPATPSLEKTRELLSEYDLALLLIGSKKNEHFYRRNRAKRRIQMKEWKATVAMERKLFLKGYYKAFGLPGEACALCEKCAYPDNCLFPNEKRPSIESCSIDIFKTIERMGKRIQLAQKASDTYQTYSLILLK
ncbi:MAG: DUF2284 domain-containing protein [Deltaproteobacteria bacterium]|nr:DUF2284 domain-containing protein [Deltaproteobacteria bacterium]